MSRNQSQAASRPLARTASSSAAHGVLSISKARVQGIDKNMTKTGEDRRIVLCPRAALAAANRATTGSAILIMGSTTRECVCESAEAPLQ